jgi:hypothetical protein
MSKCSTDLTTRCEQMDDVLDWGFVKGLSINTLRNRTTWEGRQVVTYSSKAGIKQKRHLVNFCPFCGTELGEVKPND